MNNDACRGDEPTTLPFYKGLLAVGHPSKNQSKFRPLPQFRVLRVQINQPFLMEIIILLCWPLWMGKNIQIFKQIPAPIQGCKFIFLSELHALLYHAKKKYFLRIQEWKDSLS
jgi:hypothetical protein